MDCLISRWLIRAKIAPLSVFVPKGMDAAFANDAWTGEGCLLYPDSLTE